MNPCAHKPHLKKKINVKRKEKATVNIARSWSIQNLDFATRVNYASLWKALIFADVNGIKENSVKLGAGEDLYVLFAGVLTMKTMNRVIDPAVDHLVLEGNDSDRSELQVI
ncbi:putative ABC1 protein [Platanthera zijinensis]|uniref:ABC1 protein n=1 Tax=Platanthera zijinensis TaxID=2320716 RepID=A0AAP0BSM1_9ASPA